jgi:hypothetical protein
MKNLPVPKSSETPLKVQRHLVQLVLNCQLRSYAHAALSAPLVLHNTRIGKYAFVEHHLLFLTCKSRDESSARL